MSLEKRIRVLTFCLVAFTFAEILLALVGLLEGSSLAHVALLYGIQLVLFDGFAFRARNRLQKELQQ